MAGGEKQIINLLIIKNLKIESSDIIYKLNKKVSNLKEENKILKLHIANNFSSNKMNRKISLQKKRKIIIDLQKTKNIYCWSDNYYKSNKKLFSQLYEYFLANYPEIKNNDLDRYSTGKFSRNFKKSK